mmetsp:Transcript_7337/g.17352  ORF Transcript_7337/g.17352 Transcript_7337/m.17352 type:complete len:93 (+) Transcript_7337:139-417(+)
MVRTVVIVTNTLLPTIYRGAENQSGSRGPGNCVAVVFLAEDMIVERLASSAFPPLRSRRLILELGTWLPGLGAADPSGDTRFGCMASPTEHP